MTNTLALEESADSNMQILPVGPRGVLTRTWPCGWGCGHRVYPDGASTAYRHTEPFLGFVFCPGYFGERQAWPLGVNPTAEEGVV